MSSATTTTRPRPRPRPKPRLASTTAALPSPSSSPGDDNNADYDDDIDGGSATKPVGSRSSSGSRPAPSRRPPPSPVKKARTVEDDEDEDALFIKKPAVMAWSQSQRAVKSPKRKPIVINSDSSGSDVEILDHDPLGRGYGTKKKGKGAVPDWTKSSNVNSILFSDDEQDDILIQRLSSSKSSAKPSAGREPEKRVGKKRQRSRSRSLTPPPMVSQVIHQSAVSRIRNMISIEPRAPSPTLYADDSSDTIALDPELAQIASQFKANRVPFTSVSIAAAIDAPSSSSSFSTTEYFGGAEYASDNRARTMTPGLSRGTTPTLEGGPEVVKIKVKWTSGGKSQSSQQQSEPQWIFQMKRHDGFKILIEQVARSVGTWADNVVITHEGSRVFPSASPHGIGIWAEADLEACDKATYESIRSNPRGSQATATSSSLPTTREDSNEDSDIETISPVRGANSGSSSHHNTYHSPEDDDDNGDEEEEEDDDKFKITLRSALSKDVTLTVRPTTKCGAIIKAFLKSAKLTDKYPNAGEPASAPAPAGKGKKGKKGANASGGGGGPWLVVDGDKMKHEAEIGEADLEDGDMVEVAGL